MSNTKFLKNEYLEWLLLDKHQRVIAGLPETDLEWSRMKGISDRTLRGWKNNEEFKKALEARQQELSTRVPGATLSAAAKVAVESDGTDESDYLAIKAKLIQRAAAGDKSALDTYFRTYGKQFVDDEVAARKSDFRDLDIEELYAKVLSLIPTDKLIEELASRDNA
jgi:hypothetical protein